MDKLAGAADRCPKCGKDCNDLTHTGGPPAICLTCPKPAANKRGLCRACYIAAYRRTKLGDTWEQAVEDRRWMLRRRKRVGESGATDTLI